MKDYIKYLTLGLTVFSASVIGLVIGYFTDRSFGSFPLATFIFLVLGILSGVWSLYKEIRGLV